MPFDFSGFFIGEQLGIYVDSLSDTRLIFNGLIEDVDTATDAVPNLDNAVDGIQDIASDAEKLRNLADNLGDFVSLLSVVVRVFRKERAVS